MSEQEAQDTTTSPERLEELSADPALRSIVASNPAAPASLLETLATDQEIQVRAAVASNPNTPWQTLEALAWEFPRAFLHHPMGPLQMIAHPEQISICDEFWNNLLREASIPPLWLNWLRSHPDLAVSQAVRLHIQSAGEAVHPYGIPKGEEAHDVSTLIALLSAAISQEAALPTLADHLQISPTQIIQEHLQWLAQTEEKEGRWVVASNAQTPREVLCSLARDREREIRHAVASHEQTPAEVLRLLAQDDDAEVRARVACHEQIPREILSLLAFDTHEQVRQAVAWSDWLPTEVWRMLAQDEVKRDEEEVAAYEAGLPWGVAPLDESEKSMVRQTVALNEQTPGEILWILAQDPVEIVRCSVASNEGAPAALLCTLVLNESASIRGNVAGNTRTPVEVLRTLAHDSDAGVRGAVARNEQTPVEVLRALAQDPDKWVRHYVARIARTPAEVVCTLAHDEDPKVRSVVVWNRQTPAETLAALAQDAEEDVRWAACLVQRLLVEVGETLREQNWWEHWWQIPLIERRVSPWHNTTIEEVSIEKQLGTVARLREVPDSVCQIILTSLAANWDAAKIQHAFAVSEADSIAILRTQQEYYCHLIAPFMPALALQKLAASPRWEVRYLVALHAHTPRETRLQLCQDGNRYVRAMAQAKAEMMRESTQGIPPPEASEKPPAWERNAAGT